MNNRRYGTNKYDRSYNKRKYYSKKNYYNNNNKNNDEEVKTKSQIKYEKMYNRIVDKLNSQTNASQRPK